MDEKLSGRSDPFEGLSQWARDFLAKGIDVLVLCPLAKELNASLVAFDIHPLEAEHANLKGSKIYLKEIVRKGFRPLRVAINVVTKPRNVPAAIHAKNAIQFLKPECAILSGISAGPKTETKLGDVYVSRQVWDVAGGRSEPDGLRPRPISFAPRDPIGKEIDYIQNRIGEAFPEWVEGVADLASRLRQVPGFVVPSEEKVRARRYRVALASLMCGEVVKADGTLPDYVNELDQLIRTCDMESSGFAQACEDENRQWVIFRCVVDFGDPAKAKGWQPLGAGISALAVRRFLETEIRLSSEIVDPSRRF